MLGAKRSTTAGTCLRPRDPSPGTTARRHPAAAPLVVLALALGSGPLLAGSGPATVKGKVAGWEKLLPQVYAEAARPDSHRFTWREPSPTVKQDFRRLSANVSRDVCIAAIGGAAANAHEPQKAIVTGGRITPSTVVLSPGSRLAFKNADPFPHRLYEVGSPQWQANPTAPGSSRDWAAASPGVHVIRDELFPSVTMSIVVEPNAVEFTFPDRDGNFAISLPPGEYTLKAFFDGKQTGKALDGVRVGEKDIELKDALAVGSDGK
jgi:hypothetical protein